MVRARIPLALPCNKIFLKFKAKYTNSIQIPYQLCRPITFDRVPFSKNGKQIGIHRQILCYRSMAHVIWPAYPVDLLLSTCLKDIQLV